FGAMFAPRPELVRSELIRVCRRGGVVAMAKWTPGGFAGKLFALTGRYMPPPKGIPPPAQWGDESVVRERVGSSVSRLDATKRILMIDFPFPPREVVKFFREYFGPTRTAFANLNEAEQEAFARDLEHHWQEHNQADGARTLVSAEYLEVVAVRS